LRGATQRYVGLMAEVVSNQDVLEQGTFLRESVQFG
jgi:hypothetical protein